MTVFKKWKLFNFSFGPGSVGAARPAARYEPADPAVSSLTQTSPMRPFGSS
uniref:Uncharacterized protein n=1 Tax=Anguilla anguilla TaxID=7936 RepID=A0A0E9PG63_ANGAN